ncbi:MAG: hypothetical protein PHQ90_00035 [Sulfuricurvum sp.]|nr:hypothetical protein [Sulfuricurvum sp.]
MDTIQKWFNLLIGPALAIIAFLVTYFLLNRYSTTNIPTNAIPALSLSILIMVIAQSIKTNTEIEKTSAYSDKVYEAVKNYLHVIRLGSPETAIAYIDSKFPTLKVVSNTSFNLDDEINDANERFYETEKYADFQKTLLANLGRPNLLWKEIGDETAMSRFRDLSKNMKNKKNSDRYKYKFINSLFGPQINFIILEYMDDTKEVLFNWDFRSPGQVPVVLLSRDEKIIDMFGVHFANLWKEASDDHDA